MKLAVAEVQSDLSLRATTSVTGELPADARLPDMVNVGGGGRCAITLDPKDRLPGQQPYQGVVPLHGDHKEKLTRLSDVLQHYMLQSRQLDTTLVLADQVAAGLLIQHAAQGRGQPGGRRRPGRRRPDRPERGLQPHRHAGRQQVWDIRPDRRPRPRELMRRAVADRIDGRNEAAHYSFRVERADGTPIEAEVFGMRTEFGGRPAIIGMIVDITGRRAAERAAREQLNFVSQLVEAIPSPLFHKDEHGRYLGCNKAFEVFVGRPRDEIIGRTVFELYVPAAATRYHAADQALFDTPGADL